MKATLIITVRNEQETIKDLLESILTQTTKIDEIVITDAGSTDKTKEIIGSYRKKLPLKLIELDGSANRSIGRNAAIQKATHDHILITDAGCTLDSNWVKEMKQGFSNAEVVAGFYTSDSKTVFEKCVACYVLIMPDKLNLKNFLPATRSMGITKKVWEQAGKFDPAFRYNEDYVFARRLQSLRIPIEVVPNAIVSWKPRSTLKEFVEMIYNFAYGDAYSNTWRPKVGSIFFRYAIGLLILSPSLVFSFYIYIFFAGVAGYIAFAIQKNYRYVKHASAFFYLPLLQISSDCAVMAGTLHGSRDRGMSKKDMV